MAPREVWVRRLPFLPAAYAVGIAVALFLPLLLAGGLRATGVTSGTPVLLQATAQGWLTAGVLVAIVLGLEKAPLRTLFTGRLRAGHIGLALAFVVVLHTLGPAPLLALGLFWPRRPAQPGRDRLMWIVGLVLAVVVGAFAFQYLAEVFDLGRARPGGGGRSLIEQLSIAERLVLVVTTAVTEEIRYRTYLIERLHGLRLSPGVAALVSYVLFVAAHIPSFGLDHVLRVTAVGSVGFPVLYYLTRSFWACACLHFALNIFILAV